jgi:transposase
MKIQYAKGHKYLTLVYQIDQGATRLLWVGKERTIQSFQGFFALIGEQLAAQIEFVCSDMWRTLPGCNPPEMSPGAAYPRPFPHRREDE